MGKTCIKYSMMDIEVLELSTSMFIIEYLLTKLKTKKN